MEEKKYKDWQFKPGNQLAVGHGRPRIPDDLRKIRASDQKTYMQTLHYILGLSVDEFKEIMANGKLTVMQHWIASMVLHSMSKGDTIKWSIMMDRHLGKVKDTAEYDYGSEEGEDGVSYMSEEEEAKQRKENPEYMDQNIIDMTKLYGRQSIAKVLSDPKKKARVLDVFERFIGVYGPGIAEKEEEIEREKAEMAKEAAPPVDEPPKDAQTINETLQQIDDPNIKST